MIPSDIEILARIADAVTSTAVLLIALIWQARRTVALSDRLHEVNEAHKADLRRNCVDDGTNAPRIDE